MGTSENFKQTGSDREMKLCSSLLFSVGVVTAQYADEATDRWESYDYTGGFTYPTDGKTDGGVAGASQDNYGVGENHFNGLYCWMCDERLDLGNEAETGTVHAYTRCLQRGAMMPCKVNNVPVCSRSVAETVLSTLYALVASRLMPVWP